MEFFRIRRDIPFMRHALVFNVISFVTFAAAVFFLVTRGLHLSIEFTGGTVLEVEYAQSADLAKARAAVETMDFGEVQVQNFGTSRDVMIRLPIRGDAKHSEIAAAVFAKLCAAEGGSVSAKQYTTPQGEQVSRPACTAAGGAEPLKLSRTEFVGPAVGKELYADGLKALAFVVVGIVAYLALRFEWKFSIAAIVANLHDVVIILGFFAFFQWEFSLAVLAAVLAVLGYSVNESVVIFDRIREAFRRYRKMTTREVIDHAITSTMSRTIITHGSTQMMVLAMLLFGGQTLHYFAVALTIGILFGIYSSVFVAAAIAMWLGVKREDLLRTGGKDHDPNDPNAGAVV
ncbi:MAG: protein translocase subunit SecF [Burkholderiaceae bacterium]